MSILWYNLYIFLKGELKMFERAIELREDIKIFLEEDGMQLKLRK
jgi:hypothetical protein